MKRLLIALLCFLATQHSEAQDYPRNYFSSPLEGPLILAGTFGEVRPDHFHSGIDLSTGEQEGLPVKAAADGYVSRIKISPDGFGRALYITHPNGFVTVYGHLKDFREDLQNFVVSKQYEQKSFAIELLPKKGEFKVVKGEQIARSGNSGNTSGPHLHFEIRDERSEDPINPLFFGLPVEDHAKPVFRSVRIYPLPQSGIVEHTDSARSFEIFPMDTVYSVAHPTYIQVYGVISVGIDVYDQQEGSTSELGIYSAELSIDGMKAYAWECDRFNFADTRYANSHADYEVRVRDGVKIERCFQLPGNFFPSFYRRDTSITGYFNLTDDNSHEIHFVARDYSGNKSEIWFQLQANSALSSKDPMKIPDGALSVTNSKGISVHKSYLDVSIPSGAVYQDMFYYDDEIKSNTYLSSMFLIGNRYEALHLPITVSIKPSKPIVDSLKPKAVVARLEFDGRLISEGGAWNKDFLTTKTRKFGTYVIAVDTTAPMVQKEYYPTDLNTSRGAIVQLKIKDDLSGLKSYSATVDGTWKLMEYDAKNDLMILDLKGMPTNNHHPIEITVTDERGNTSVWKDSFWW